MPRWQYPDWLSAKALGTDGGQELTDGSTMPAGIHLRWDFESAIGFPRGGFDIYRREHYAGKKLCGVFFPADGGGINLVGPGIGLDYITVTTTGDRSFVDGCGQPIPDTAIFLPDAQTLRLDLLVPVRHVEITLDPSSPDPVVADAYWNSAQGEVLVDRALARPNASGNWEINLYADRIDRVLVRGRDMVVCRACFVLVRDGLDQNWGQLPINAPNVIHLPITHAEWPGTHPHQPDDVAEADARLPSGLPADVRDTYLDGFESELHAILSELVGTQPQQRCYVDEPGAGESLQPAPTRLRWQALQLLRLTALDPNLARILGLYWHDADAQPGQLYDYRIVGHWEDRPFPGKRFDFDQLTPGSRFTSGLEYEGLKFLSPNLITVVEETWDGVSSTALEILPQILEAPTIISLSNSAKSVTLRLKGDSDLEITALTDDQEVGRQTAQAGEDVLTFVDTRGITSLQFEVSARVVIIECVARLSAETIGDLNYVTFRHRVSAPRRVPETSLEAPVLLPGQTRFNEDGTIREGQAVALRWQPLDVGDGYLAPDAPIFYHVQRSYRGDEAAPGPFDDITILNEESPIMLSRDALEAPFETENGRILPCYIDHFLPDGWYSYRVRGIDLFGRLSTWGELQTIQVRDKVAPPPPISVAAGYLDPADRWLPSDDASHAPGIKVAWEWPGIQHFQAPDVAGAGQFRIYLQKGELNTLQGQVLAVTSTVTSSTLETDATWPGAADALDREWVRVNGVYFPVVSHSRGPNFTIAVGNLSMPDQFPEPGAFTLTFSPYGLPLPDTVPPHGPLGQPSRRPLEQPLRGQMRITSRPRNEYWSDYRDPLSWERRLHIEPAAEMPVVMGQIAAVADGTAPDEIIIATDQALEDADGVLTPGVLVSGGLMYQVRSHDLENRLTMWTSAHPVPSDPPGVEQVTVQPSEGDSFVYYPGRRYHVYLPQSALPSGAVSGTAVANIGVTAADGTPYVADDPKWSLAEHGGLGEQPGNEGSVSSPAKIIAVDRAVLPGIGSVPDAGDEPIYARPADYFGQARYTLTWTAMAGASEYTVCRCSGGAFFDQDMKLRRERKGYYADPNLDIFADDPGFSAWLAEHYPDLTADSLTTEAWRDWAAHFYPAQPDAKIQEIANRLGNEAAFRRVNEGIVTSTAYMDTFDGLGQGFYLYRVRAINAAGQLGDWSRTYPPVHIFDVTPPAMPLLTSITGGERSITVTWRANAERDLASYHVWRAGDAASLTDVRRLPPHAVVTPNAGAVLESFTDSVLIAGTPFYYRLAAVDANGNISRPSAVGAAKAVDTSAPAPPEWVDAYWHRSEGGILLRWTLAEQTHEALVQRSSPESGGIWLSVTGWLPPGTNRHADVTALTTETYSYRLRVRSASGNLNTAYNQIEVAPPAGDEE